MFRCWKPTDHPLIAHNIDDDDGCCKKRGGEEAIGHWRNYFITPYNNEDTWRERENWKQLSALICHHVLYALKYTRTVAHNCAESYIVTTGVGENSCSHLLTSVHSSFLVPTLHSFCHQCLKGLCHGGMIVCPTCQRESHLEEGSTGPASLLITVVANHNTLETEVVEMKDGDQSSTLCENCDGDPAPATVGCLDCKGIFCDECNKRLHANKKFKEHIVIPIEKYDSALRETKHAETIARLSKCRTHPSNELEYSCNQVSKLHQCSC